MKGCGSCLRTVVCVLFLIIYPSITIADQGTPFDKIVFFGDSLSDTGTLYHYSFGLLPLSPPYFDGRFTNGYLWSEQVAKHFYDKRYIGFRNYAVAGETAVFHDPLNGFLPYSLSMSVSSYLWHTILQDRSTTLFVIWIGGNDYLRGAQDVDSLTSVVVNAININIQKLMSKGGRNFLVINIPNIAQLPIAKNHPTPQILDQLSVAHNVKLKQMVSKLQEEFGYINIHLFDANELMTNLLRNPEFYNKKYNVNLVNTTASCWIKKSSIYNIKESDELDIQRRLRENMKNHQSLHKNMMMPSDDEIKGMAHYIATSPSLYEVYSVSEEAENGMIKPCDKPGEYVFWDAVHPSSIIHYMFAHRAIEFIEQHYSHI